MFGAKDITGQRFGQLTVVARDTSPSLNTYSKRAHWICKCDCGGQRSIQGTRLRLGLVKSCGCLNGCPANREFGRLKPTPERAMSTLFTKYKAGAKSRRYVWDIGRELFNAVVGRACSYCGLPGPSGLDRVDSLKGYTPDSIASCCYGCNMAKRTSAVEDFIALCNRVARMHPRPA